MYRSDRSKEKEVKIEVELHKLDIYFLALALILGSITSIYWIYRETAIRESLVMQARSAAYGKGVSDQINAFVDEEAKVLNGKRRGMKNGNTKMP